MKNFLSRSCFIACLAMSMCFSLGANATFSDSLDVYQVTDVSAPADVQAVDGVSVLELASLSDVSTASVASSVGTWSAAYQPVPPGKQYPSAMSPHPIANAAGYYNIASVSGACTVGELHKYYSWGPTIPGRGWIAYYHQTCN